MRATPVALAALASLALVGGALAAPPQETDEDGAVLVWRAADDEEGSANVQRLRFAPRARAVQGGNVARLQPFAVRADDEKPRLGVQVSENDDGVTVVGVLDGTLAEVGSLPSRARAAQQGAAADAAQRTPIDPW